MALPNAYAQYKNSKVLTASPAELTLMLYEGAIKFCNIAIAAIEQKEVEKAHVNIRKAQKIIEHLRVTLDMKYPVAKEMKRRAAGEMLSSWGVAIPISTSWGGESGRATTEPVQLSSSRLLSMATPRPASTIE